MCVCVYECESRRYLENNQQNSISLNSLSHTQTLSFSNSHTHTHTNTFFLSLLHTQTHSWTYVPSETVPVGCTSCPWPPRTGTCPVLRPSPTSASLRPSLSSAQQLQDNTSEHKTDILANESTKCEGVVHSQPY